MSSSCFCSFEFQKLSLAGAKKVDDWQLTDFAFIARVFALLLRSSKNSSIVDHHCRRRRSYLFRNRSRKWCKTGSGQIQLIFGTLELEKEYKNAWNITCGEKETKIKAKDWERERERERESNKDKNRAEKALLHRKEIRSDEDLREIYFNNRM